MQIHLNMDLFLVLLVCHFSSLGKLMMKLHFYLIYPQSSTQLFSPLFGKFGGQLGPKMCFNIGSVLHGACGFLFGFLPYFKDVRAFIGLSYLLRFLEGLGAAMAWSAALGILMKIFPDKVSSSS